MNLQNIKKMKEEKGFTIVELLIVIVVIGILAAIVLIAFNGVQSRAKTTSAKSTASGVQKKIEAYNAAQTNYPDVTTVANMTSALNGIVDSKLEGGMTIATTSGVTDSNGQKTVAIYRCSTAIAYSVVWWDYTASTPGLVSATNGLKSGADCADWTAATALN
jgi:prepilin-type N-terminal cleavage/methylation domain-containing protein